MQKGYSVLFILIIILSLFIFPLFFWAFNNKNIFRSDVRGVSSVGAKHIKPGFSVSLTSKYGTWELYGYLCKSKDECEESLESGKHFYTVGGGEAEEQEIYIESNDDWKSYEFVKLYVKPGWGSKLRAFNVSTENIPVDMIKTTLSENSDEYEIVLMPVSKFLLSFYKAVNFTD